MVTTRRLGLDSNQRQFNMKKKKLENNVYILSTDSEELFDDLDQIAKSFRYAP